ncbi:MAG: GH116 family glycosyl-hydrolase [Acidilobus sp.]
MGGVGTGSFEVGPDGRFREWLIFNNRPWANYGQPEWFMGPDDLVFFLRVEVEGEEPQLRGLFTGLWYSTCEDYTYRGCGPWVVMEPYHIPWAKPVEAVEIEVRYPVVALRYRDALLEEAGLEVEAELISPLLPGDLRTSSTPAVLMRFHIVNKGGSTVRASIMAVARNPARSAGATARTDVVRAGGWSGMVMRAEGVGEGHPMRDGALAVALAGEATGAVIKVNASDRPQLVRALRNLLVDFRGDGAVSGATSASSSSEDVFASLASRPVELKPGSSTDVDWVIAWYFPNHVDAAGQRVGHYYENFFSGVEQVVDYALSNRDELRERAKRFSSVMYNVSYPSYVADLVTAQLTSLPKLTWLTKEGHFGVWEGGPGCCGLNTVDVMLWAFTGVVNMYPELVKAAVKDVTRHILRPDKHYWYELFALAYPENMSLYREMLGRDPSIQNYPERLSAAIAEVVKRTGKDPTGRVPHSFRASFDLIDTYDRNDLMPELLLLALLAYYATGDGEFLRSIWGDLMTVVEGTRRQHDSLGTGLIEHYMPSDYEGMSRVAAEASAKGLLPGLYGGNVARVLFSGPMYVMNSVNTFDTFSLLGVASFTGDLWAASLKAMAEAARREGLEGAEALRGYSEKAYDSLVKILWNGSYFDDWYDPVSGLRDRAVLSAQLTGEWYLRLLGLGPGLGQDKVRSALREVYARNFRRWEGLLNGTYPGSPRPSMVGDVEEPNGTGILNRVGSQADTPWTGVEFGVASQMIYEGLVKEGLELLRSVHDRYASWGLYFNHLECNGHYSRPLAALTIPNAIAGVTYDGVAKELTISPRLGSPFRGPALVSGSLLSIESAGPCPGVITVRHVDGLPLTLTSIRVDARGCLARVKVNGAEVNVTVEGDRVKLGEAITLRPGDVLEVSLSTTG